jgi:hypothetical protein
MTMNFLTYYLQSFIRPQRTFDRLMTDPRRLKFGIGYITIPAVLYIFVYIFLNHGGGAPSVFTPWLNIPRESYYYYNRFLTAPSFYISWILAVGVVQLLSKPFKGQGSFEDTLAVLGLGTAVAMWGTMLHDLVMSFLGAIRVISLSQHEIDMNSPTIWRTVIWTCMIIYLIWFIVMFSKGIAAAHKLDRGKALLLGVIGFIVFQGMFLVFNR